MLPGTHSACGCARKMSATGLMITLRVRFATARRGTRHLRMHTEHGIAVGAQGGGGGLGIPFIEAEIEDGLLMLWVSVDPNPKHLDCTFMHQRDCVAHIDAVVRLQ